VLVSNLLEGHTDTVTDVEWAPQFGRSFHMIASCSLDKTLIVWKVILSYNFNNDHFENICVKFEKIFSHKHEFEVNFYSIFNI
jgi:hypothetical protein